MESGIGIYQSDEGSRGKGRKVRNLWRPGDGRSRLRTGNQGFDIRINEEDVESAFDVARSSGYNVEGLPLNFQGGQMRLKTEKKNEKK